MSANNLHINMGITPKELQKFGLILGGLFVVFFYLVFPKVFGAGYHIWPGAFAGVLAVLALIAPKLLKPIFVVWSYIGEILGFINTRIILGLVFYVMMTPISIIMKILGKDLIGKKLDPKAKTYRQPAQDIHLSERPF